MPKSTRLTSGEALERPESSSVYDFLYHDARRVGSYLAQFDPSGLLQSIKQTIETGESEQSESHINASANAAVAKISSHKKVQAGAANRDAAERQYDPYWVNARSLLDFLSSRDMIVRDLDLARIGQFILVPGSLSILDLNLFRGLWSNPAVKKAIAVQSGLQGVGQPSGNREQRRKAQAIAHDPQIESSPVEAMIAIMNMMPHTIQARIRTLRGDECWGTLAEESLVVSSSDLALKHGRSVTGEWNMLGVLDAFPDAHEIAPPQDDALPDGGLLSTLMQTMLPIMRTLVGRPPLAHGITPVLIFREVSA